VYEIGIEKRRPARVLLIFCTGWALEKDSMKFEAEDKISKYFTYKEALWLPSWGRMACELDGLDPAVLHRLKGLFTLMDNVRDYFNAPIRVHCAYRPKEYNALVNGAKASAHLADRDMLAAVDFHIPGSTTERVIARILNSNLLDTLKMRMENNGPNPAWIHMDTKPCAKDRYFLP
jgi:hypothetical protein